MMYEDVVCAFALRTKQNLEFIDTAAKTNPDVYEVTQLVNSFLGLLVFPQQKYFDKIPKTPIETLQAEGWPIPCASDNCKNLQDLMRCLRNAVAHFNIEFCGNQEITSLKMWNYPYDNETGKLKTNRPSWEITLDLTQLRAIIDRFSALIIRRH